MQIELRETLLVRPGLVPVVGLPQVVLDVLVTDNSGTISMIGDEVLERSWRTSAVEGEAAIRKEDQDGRSRTQHPMDLLQLPERVREMLEQVAGDDEVLAAIVERRETVDIEIHDDVRLRERGAGVDVGEQLEVFIGLPTIQVSHGHAGVGDGQRVVARPELDARSIEETRKQDAAGRARPGFGAGHAIV